MSTQRDPAHFAPTDTFIRRHIGPTDEEQASMLDEIGCGTLDELMDETLPASIRLGRELEIGPERSESDFLGELRMLANKNLVRKSYIGMGYHGTLTPGVILRNVLESPGWYTQYTPYQAEISQGRLEALLTFQTMVSDLTGLPLANASLLDEASAAAEALALCHRALRGKRNTFFVSESCHPQTIAVVRTRARALDIEVLVGDAAAYSFEGPAGNSIAGVLLQYPASTGAVLDYGPLVERVHSAGALVVVACDLLALTLLRPPGEFGADVAVGTSQRFGVPLGFGGPHAAFLAAKEAYKRQIPGRIIGVSIDAQGRPALRMALQTREQHIRREKATSNICTAQALLAIIAAFYGVYHGPAGLRRIAERIRRLTRVMREALGELGFQTGSAPVFDTLLVHTGKLGAEKITARAERLGFNLRHVDEQHVGLAFDETATLGDVRTLAGMFADAAGAAHPIPSGEPSGNGGFQAPLARTSDYLTHPVFTKYHSEHEMLRYIRRLEARDLSLTTSMIPLGSCTMKLNATSEMIPITWPEFGALHPFCPAGQWQGYRELFRGLEHDLLEITGFEALSLQPNAGAQGEYAGLLAIRGWHESRGDAARNVVLIPVSAHGTNPASAILAGLSVVTVACDEEGNIDVDDLKEKARQHADDLAALMVTYPSTHGVFEESIREICETIHGYGGQVYLDGANMNALVGLCRPGDFGADVCHLNLHKTFAIPHGGGGPGVGPIAVAAHLAPFLPGDPLARGAESETTGAVAATFWGSAGVLPISYAYIRMMGGAGLARASRIAILSANYMAQRLAAHYPILFRGEHGRVAHEFIIDIRPLEKVTGISVEDVAKRLMDYGFHAPTMSFPVPGTLMIEPTESESKSELDRLCEALILIRDEIRAVEEGRMDRADNPLKNAPHTAACVTAEDWQHPYTRRTAAFPAPWTNEHKFWPPVGRVDNGYGDRHLVSSCPPLAATSDDPAPNPSNEYGRPGARAKVVSPSPTQ